MIEQTSGSKTGYVATFPNDEKDSLLEIAFNRKGSQVSAPDSSVTLPTPFDLERRDELPAGGGTHPET